MQINKTVHRLGELTLLYVDVDGIMSFVVVPTSLADKVTNDKFDMQYIRKNGFTHVQNKPMVQLALLGDVGEKEFFAGKCMQNASSCYEFRYTAQHKKTQGDVTEIVTEFANGKGQFYEHHVRKPRSCNALECYTVLRNEGDPVTVEMMASFSLGCISPFCAENDVENIYVYRLRTNWSAEAKPEVASAADLQMEDSWSSYGIRQVRMGQVGSMPCREYMPFCAVEDRTHECVWAVSLEAPASWQIDAVHHQTSISLTGGAADFESGHWRKTLRKGESYCTDSGFLTAVHAGFEKACAALQEIYDYRLQVSRAEESLPVIYNEYCCSWGNPCISTLKPMIDECARLGVGEFVVDVGWWRQDERSWYTLGDWNVSPHLFPNGMGELTSYIRSKGMIPGLWFEFESVSCDSLLFASHRDWLLTRDGRTIQHRERALLDFRKPEVYAYVTEKVIRTLRDNNFGYVKIDYNEPIGIGCDGAESYGAGLREHIACVLRFIEDIKKAIPDIVVEICSSGGHRLEPKFLRLASMASFSDAHMGAEGAVIAADLHRYMLPRQMQIWATIDKDYTPARNYFTMAKGMLGRYCLSGDLLSVSLPVKEVISRSVSFYKKIVPVLKAGETLANMSEGMGGLRKLHGKRFVLRLSKDGKQAVAWIFSFDGEDTVTVQSDALKGYEITDSFVYGTVEKPSGDKLTVKQTEKDDLLGAVVLLAREDV